MTDSTTRSADIAPTHLTLAGAAFVVAANAVLFALLAYGANSGGWLVARDEAVLDWFVEHRTDGWIRAARLLSTLGSFGSLSILGATLGIWLWRRRSRPVWAVVPIATLCAASLTSTVLKSIFDRSRPPVALHATTVNLAGSFPSGHATDAAAFCLAAAFTLSLTVARRVWHQVALVACGVIAAAMVGLSRLLLGVHWLSDVLAGWTLGTAYAVAMVVTTWYLTTRVPTSAPTQRAGIC